MDSIKYTTKIELAAIKSVVAKLGYELQEQFADGVSTYIWRHNRTFQILVPDRDDFSDYNLAVSSLISDLAKSSKLRQDRIEQMMVFYRYDEFRKRIVNADMNTIKLEDAVKSINNLKTLLDSAARSVKASKRRILGSRDKFTASYLDGTRFGQTEIGSFVIRAFVPVGDILDDKTPYFRSATDKLQMALKKCEEFADLPIEQKTKANVLSTIPFGVNSNTCGALVDSLADSDVEFTIDYSNVGSNQEESVVASFKSNDRSLFDEMRNILKENEHSYKTEITGFVVKLERGPIDENGIIHIHAQVGGKAKNVKIELDSIHYDLAQKAHRDRGAVTVVGDLDLGVRSSIMENVEDFRFASSTGMFDFMDDIDEKEGE